MIRSEKCGIDHRFAKQTSTFTKTDGSTDAAFEMRRSA